MGDILDEYGRELLANLPSTIDKINKEVLEDYNVLMTFRLLSLTITDHRILGNVHLDFLPG